MEKLLKAFDPEAFRNSGHILVDLLADHLKYCLQKPDGHVIDFITPDKNYKDWKDLEFTSGEDIFKAILDNSIHLHHPKYMGHQVTVPLPMAALAGFEGLMLNSGGAIYEMSAAASTIERLVIDELKPYFGFDEGDGIITSGGTLANLTALICARNIKVKQNVWNEGTHEKYAFMVSEEAHYCIDRAVRIMGWGENGMIKILVDGQYKMRTDLLAAYHQDAIKRGITVLGVVGSAPTTSTGIYDDLASIGDYCQDYDLWFHIDAAHGGPAAFSNKYKHLMNGSQLADSIAVDAHKMMMVPSLTTMLFFKKSEDSYKTFAQKAQYLWSAADDEWYNYGKRTMECTKVMLSTRIFILMKLYGMDIFEEYLDRCYELGTYFAQLISQNAMFELAVMPDSNIVCFRVTQNDLHQANEVNAKVRQWLLEDGEYYIVQTMLRETVYLRISIMNPFTEESDLSRLLSKITDYVSALN